RILQKAPEAPDILSVLDRVGREIARDFPEVGAHREDMHKVVQAEVERYENEGPTTEYTETTEGLPELPPGTPPTEVLYYLDPYTTSFEAHVVWSEGP